MSIQRRLCVANERKEDETHTHEKSTVSEQRVAVADAIRINTTRLIEKNIGQRTRNRRRRRRRRSKWLKTSSIGFGAIKSIYRDSERERVHIYQQTNAQFVAFYFNTTVYLPISVNFISPSHFCGRLFSFSTL